MVSHNSHNSQVVKILKEVKAETKEFISDHNNYISKNELYNLARIWATAFVNIVEELEKEPVDYNELLSLPWFTESCYILTRWISDLHTFTTCEAKSCEGESTNHVDVSRLEQWLKSSNYSGSCKRIEPLSYYGIEEGQYYEQLFLSLSTDPKPFPYTKEEGLALLKQRYIKTLERYIQDRLKEIDKFSKYDSRGAEQIVTRARQALLKHQAVLNGDIVIPDSFAQKQTDIVWFGKNLQ